MNNSLRIIYVLTMLTVFESLFKEVGENIFDHLELKEQQILARHWWSDGTEFDLLFQI